jgi:hypothetical protein
VPDAGVIKPLPPKLASNVIGEKIESFSGGVWSFIMEIFSKTLLERQ